MKCIGELNLSEIPEITDLEHYGILGQKWGIRRYQNEDGTLTEEGKRRYGSDKAYDSESKNWKGKDAPYLTDEELNRRNLRLQREQQYRNLTESPVKKEFINAAKKILVASAVGVTAAAMTKNYKVLIEAGGKFLKSKFAAAALSFVIGRAVR